MNIYDTAHRLAAEIQNSDECVRLRELRERAYADDTNRVLLDEYKRLQYRLQLKMAQGERMDEDDMGRLQKISGHLQFNDDASAFLLSEFRFQRIIADIYKILADVSGINMDLLQ